MIKIIGSNFEKNSLDIDIINLKYIILSIEDCERCKLLINELKNKNILFGTIITNEDINLVKKIALILKLNKLDLPLVLHYNNGKFEKADMFSSRI